MLSNEEVVNYNEKVIAEFRSSDGNVEGMSSLLLLNTVGAKSGKPRTSPLVYSTDGDRLIVIAAFRGSPKHPNWFHNLVANPDVAVELGGDRIVMGATEAKGAERERLFEQHAESVPVIKEYQAKTSRTIPVVVLSPVGSTQGK